jgi:hypothetical protein
VSVGGFVSALELVAAVVDALCESGESFAEFRSLVAQLETLQVALESINCLEVDDAQQGEVVALRRLPCSARRLLMHSGALEEQRGLTTGGTTSVIKL